MKIAVLGAGLMGRAAVFDVARAAGVTQVGVFDIDPKLAQEVANKYGDGKAVSAQLDAGNEDAVFQAIQGYDSLVSCVTYKYNPGITRAAIRAKCNMVDLGGNNDAVNTALEMDAEAAQAGITIIPDCGLAPGMVSIIATDGINQFASVNAVKIRVGGLPQSPRPPLNYQMVFSAEGLINEYWEPCVILEDGKKRTVNPMTGVELLSFDGIGKLEAFYTSGGTSTLPDTFEGRIENLDYKTIRYPGHCQLFKTMLDIGLASWQPISVGAVQVPPREVLKAVLDKNLNFGGPDLVLVRISIEGEKDGRLKTIVYEIVDRQDSKTGLTAMMRTTAFPAAIIAWMAAAGQITVKGVKPQEVAVAPALFLPQLKKRGIILTIKED
ncbi:MAG: saccharopine dehydrogenase NADP-binding domain-containing protein [bacterium]|nr:saccharopine dehydrogenase NADP-binding domain-containing protein [bacterium]